MDEALIYGKDDTQRIVSIEVQDDEARIYTEDDRGGILSYPIPNQFWLLAPEPLDRGQWHRMKGELHYKYGRQYTSREKFLKDRGRFRRQDIFTIYDQKEALMVKDGLTYYKGMKPEDVSVLAFDIEATGLNPGSEDKVLLIANTFRSQGRIIRKLFCYDEFESQADMLQDWCAWVAWVNPSIILGHNIFGYDLWYLNEIAKREGIDLRLGRDGSALWFDTYESKFRKEASQFYHYKKAHVYGRELVDTMFLAIRYDQAARKYESYALKPIIRAEGLEIPGRVFYDASKIRHTYKDPAEWKKIKQYSIEDGDDALALFDRMSPPYFYLAQTVPKPFQLILESASGSQINAVMIRAYLQRGHSLPKASDRAEYQGAISFGNPGIYRNVFKIDLASLYPSIMLQYEVCDKEKDPDGMFLKLIRTFTDKRLEYKKRAKETGDRHFDDLQTSYKLFINAGYGFLGAAGLLFNSPAKAEFVTKTGREILQETISIAKSKEFIISFADTDSISISKKDMSEFSEEERKQIISEVNSHFPERIRFEDDGYFPCVVVTKAKNYVTWDGRKLKFKGSALRAPTKEPALQEFIRALLTEMVEGGTRFTDIYNLYVDEALHLDDIKRWATRKTITSAVLGAKRTNEKKVKDALAGSEYVEGDRAYFFFKSDNSLCLAEHFNGDYHLDKLLEKLFKTAKIFDTLLDVKKLFPNYKLKKNKKLLMLQDDLPVAQERAV